MADAGKISYITVIGDASAFYARLTADMLANEEGHFVVLDRPVSRRVSVHRGVALICAASRARPVELGEETIAVAASDNTAVLRALSRCAHPVICAGLGHRDTLTAASLTPEHAMLSLQRSIHTLRGELEACEIGVQLNHRVDPMRLLLASAAVIAAGGGYDSRTLVI